MKKLVLFSLLTCTLLFAGCSVSDPFEEVPGEVIASSEMPGPSDTHQTESKPNLDEPDPKNSAPETSAVPDSSAESEEPDNITLPADPEQDSSGKNEPDMTEPTEASEPQPSQPEEPKDIPQQSPKEPPVPTEPAPPVVPESPAESLPEPDPEPETPPIDTEEPEPEFDVNQWVSFAKEYGQQIGLSYDESVTDCWDNPIIASPNSIYLERDITSRLDRYLRKGMSAFCVWSELRSDGRYDIYIGYA